MPDEPLIAEIRHAEPQERDALSELHARASWVVADNRMELPGYHEMLAAHPEVLGVAAETIAQGRVRVAVALDGRLLGFCIVCDVDGGERVLDDLFVDPAVMNGGVGSALVGDAVRGARDAGRSTMTVVSNPGAVAFYERIGFVSDGPVQTRFGPAMRLRLPLR